MKIVKKLMIAAVLVFMLACPCSASASLGYMRISFIENDVQIKTPEAGEWGGASINSPLAEGDEVWVPQGGRAELQLNTGAYIRLDGNTALQILSLDEDSSQFYLSQGNAYIFYDAPRGSVIQVDTPDASTRAFDRAIFGLSMSDQYTDVAVYKGYVETENEGGQSRVNAGDVASLGPDTAAVVAPIGPPDDWELWNHRRNERLLEAQETESSRYLPPELRTYSSDLDSSGRWVHVPEYGYVWTPRGFVSVGWSPYRDGRWIWRGGDYVWVAYEPWGWVPYHYGRWSFAPSIGWFWVPPARGSVYWGPGYVGWVRTPDYVGWVPLAPGEIYYGRGYFGRHSVNITKVNINRIHITNVYRNVSVNNGPIIVNQQSFLKGPESIVHVDKRIIHEKIFTGHNIRPGAPDIRPTRESYFASDKKIPHDQLPPESVRQLHVRELKESRRLMREPDKSVLNPGAATKALPVVTVNTPRTPGKGKPRLERLQPEGQGQPAIPEGGGREKREQKQMQPEMQQPGVSEGGRRSRGNVQPPQQPAQQAQPEALPQPGAAPTEGPGNIKKERRQQLVIPEEGRKTREKVQQQPAQQEQPETMQQPPAAAESPMEIRRERRQQQPGAPAEGWRTRENVQPPPQPAQQEQPEVRQQPPATESPMDIRRERRQQQPGAPAEGWRTRENVQPPPQPAQQEQPEVRQQPPAAERPMEIRRERRQQQPAQLEQPEVRQQPPAAERPMEIRRERRQQQPDPSVQPVVPQEGRKSREKAQQQQPAQQEQSAAPECGPGQKDQNNPEKCPQNFQKRLKPNRFER